jgi:hypothetical protein
MRNNRHGDQDGDGQHKQAEHAQDE